MIDTLKKQWFVVLIALIFIGFTVFIIYDTNKGKLPGKSEYGKDVIATINGKSISADDLYDSMYQTVVIPFYICVSKQLLLMKASNLQMKLKKLQIN